MRAGVSPSLQLLRGSVRLSPTREEIRDALGRQTVVAAARGEEGALRASPGSASRRRCPPPYSRGPRVTTSAAFAKGEEWRELLMPLVQSRPGWATARDDLAAGTHAEAVDAGRLALALRDERVVGVAEADRIAGLAVAAGVDERLRMLDAQAELERLGLDREPSRRERARSCRGRCGRGRGRRRRRGARPRSCASARTRRGAPSRVDSTKPSSRVPKWKRTPIASSRARSAGRIRCRRSVPTWARASKRISAGAPAATRVSRIGTSSVVLGRACRACRRSRCRRRPRRRAGSPRDRARGCG